MMKIAKMNCLGAFPLYSVGAESTTQGFYYCWFQPSSLRTSCWNGPCTATNWWQRPSNEVSMYIDWQSLHHGSLPCMLLGLPSTLLWTSTFPSENQMFLVRQKEWGTWATAAVPCVPEYQACPCLTQGHLPNRNIGYIGSGSPPA